MKEETLELQYAPGPARNLCLPVCHLPGGGSLSVDERLVGQSFPEPFSTETLAAALAQRCSASAVDLYLDSYRTVMQHQILPGMVHGRHPVLFYAIEINDADCVRTLLSYRAKVSEAKDHYGVPALAFAVMRSHFTVVNPVEVMKVLLSFGADPRVIPEDMWCNYLDSPSPLAPRSLTGQGAQATAWCTNGHRQLLAKKLDLSVRYHLHKASILLPTKARAMQLARAHKYVPLLKVPYLIIGQHYACNQVVKVITSHLGMNVKSPLVLTFAGSSGHGKTELATQIGKLLDAPITVIDCAQMRSDVSIFGPRMGYAGNPTGSQLNNFLATNDGSRAVIFLDEFDKTEREVRNSLLLLLDSGEYHDRRSNNPVNARKVIWILATNLGDTKISEFYSDHMEECDELTQAKAPHKVLTNSLKALFRDKFGAPMAGRMRNVAPFYPFSHGEQAVVTHKFLLELADDLRKPIDLQPTVNHYPGHIDLAIKNDGALCTHLAEETYIKELGARSLSSAVDDVRRAFFAEFVDTDEEIVESQNGGPLAKYTVQLLPVGKDAKEAVVVRNGVTEFSHGPDDGSAVEMEMMEGMGRASLGDDDDDDADL